MGASDFFGGLGTGAAESQAGRPEGQDTLKARLAWSDAGKGAASYFANNIWSWRPR